MIIRSMFGLGVAAIWIGSAVAQGVPPSYQADPTVYKVIFEDPNFRVIAATWKKGSTDQPHSHSLPFVTYALDDCTIRIHNADGTTRDLKNQTGVANTGPITVSHTAENVGASDCRALLIERK
jgi:hypothetical protein